MKKVIMVIVVSVVFMVSNAFAAPGSMWCAKEIDDQLNKALEGIDGGSKWPGMSYEQGVEAALNWVQGHYENAPMDDD